MCGIHILIFEVLHSCCMSSCASRINGCWLDVRHRIHIGNGNVPRQCFTPSPWYKRGTIRYLAVLENKTRLFFVSRNFGTFHDSPDDIIDHGVALMTCNGSLAWQAMQTSRVDGYATRACKESRSWLLAVEPLKGGCLINNIIIIIIITIIILVPWVLWIPMIKN